MKENTEWQVRQHGPFGGVDLVLIGERLASALKIRPNASTSLSLAMKMRSN